MRFGGSSFVEMIRTFVQPERLSIYRRKSIGVLLPLERMMPAKKAQHLPSGEVSVTPAFVSLTRQSAGIDHLKYIPCWG
jgi:hypothetical protein